MGITGYLMMGSIMVFMGTTMGILGMEMPWLMKVDLASTGARRAGTNAIFRTLIVWLDIMEETTRDYRENRFIRALFILPFTVMVFVSLVFFLGFIFF